MPKPNHLANESSPYLLQHAHNPVDWYPWGEEALKKAKEENKLIIVSIGYASCHWCHVMERESFEDERVAEVMNEFFVSIKVDREERPDLDHVYMDAVHLMGQSGGWPLNCVTLPDGSPIWAITYAPRKTWLKALQELRRYYEDQPDSARSVADRLLNGIRLVDRIVAAEDPFLLTRDSLEAVLPAWKAKFDSLEGGVARVPKFPMPNNFVLVQRMAHFTGDRELQEVMDLTLTKMARGGIFDQLGGGFARYSTDGRWLVPHFEKMLYDNGQLVSLYSEAYLVNPDPLYREVVYKTLDWVSREMTSPEGGFYSSLDADSEGEEGKFYVWTSAEIDSILGEDAPDYKVVYNIRDTGNWEHGMNILHVRKSLAEIADSLDTKAGKLEKMLSVANQKLLAAREKRIRPALDDKILASWNGLMLKGFVDAYRAFGEPRFLDIARKNAQFIISNMRNGSGLWRITKGGRSSIPAFLDDYAIVMEGFLSLYQVSGEESWLKVTEELADYVTKHFHDEESGMFFFTSDEDAALIARKIENTDNVISSSNSILANQLFLLGLLKERPDFSSRAEKMMQITVKQAITYPEWYANWLNLLTRMAYPHYEIAIAGPDAIAVGTKLYRENYLPNAILVTGTDENSATNPLLKNRFVKGKTLIYVCQNKTCKLPVDSVKEAMAEIRRQPAEK